MSLSNKIKASIQLSKLIEQKTGAKFIRKGKNLWCRCPLHGEKTASFVVYEYKNYFYCFGCHAHGDIFSFLMAYENKDFSKVMEELCETLGIRYHSSAVPESRLEEKAIENLLIHAQEHYRSNLNKFEFAKKYAEARKISKYEALGYAHENDVIDYLLQKGHRMDAIAKAGITTTTNNDRLKNRLIFPIFSNKKIVAFAGRSMNDDIKPKYINYAETELFHKQLCLFNDNFCHKNAPVIITEGYIDAIAIHLNTKYNGVCIMGTTLSSEQLMKALKINYKVYLMFDNDLAGQQAIARNLENILPMLQPGYQIYVCEDMPAKDADEIVNTLSEEHFQRIIDKSLRLSQWIRRHISIDDDKSAESTSIILDKTNEILQQITNESVRAAYKKYLEKPEYIPKKRQEYSPVIESENVIMSILYYYPINWVNHFEILSVYEFHNKTYREINEYLCNILIKNDFNMDIFKRKFDEKKYLLSKNKEIVNNLPNIISGEEFTESFIIHLLHFLMRYQNDKKD